MNYRDGYPIECLVNILEYKLKRNAPKDQKDIEMIKKLFKKKMILKLNYFRFNTNFYMLNLKKK